MKITIASVGLDLTEALEAYIAKKFGVLAKIVARFEVKGDVPLRIEVARTTKHHRKGEVYRVTAQIRLPKRVLRVEEMGSDMRAAVDCAKDVLKTEIEKFKEKTTDIVVTRKK